MCGFGISRQPRGTALVIVMLVMAVLLLAGTTFLTISSTESQIALNERASGAAQVLAEAAVHKAIAILNADPKYAGESNTALGGGTFTVTVASAAVQRCPGDTAKDLTAMASVPVGGGLFEKAGAAVAPVYSARDIVEDPHIRQTEMLTEVDDDELGPLLMHNVMWRMSETPGKIRFTGRRLGADTNAILEEMGYSPVEVQALRDDGVVR